MYCKNPFDSDVKFPWVLTKIFMPIKLFTIKTFNFYHPENFSSIVNHPLTSLALCQPLTDKISLKVYIYLLIKTWIIKLYLLNVRIIKYMINVHFYITHGPKKELHKKTYLEKNHLEKNS
jgi:hypothetical protein